MFNFIIVMGIIGGIMLLVILVTLAIIGFWMFMDIVSRGGGR